LHTWLDRYETEGLEGLMDPVASAGVVSASNVSRGGSGVVELVRTRPYRGPRQLVFELGKWGVSRVPSESAAYRALVCAQIIDLHRRPALPKMKRWERAAMPLWQTDIVGGFTLADGSSARALTGVDGHSRMCVRPADGSRAHPLGV